MRKQTLTKNQIEILKASMRCTVQYHYNEYQAVSNKIQQIDKFLKAAADLYLIDYSEVAKIMKQVGDAGLSELELQRSVNN